jgi:predicted transcriptional regulator
MVDAMPATSDTKDTKVFTIRVPDELAYRMSVLAAKERKSREQWIREALRLVVERQEQRDA